MASFRVDKVYYLPHRDLVVLAGVAESGHPRVGGGIDLPRQIKGPGWVPISDVQTVQFGEAEKVCVVIDYAVLEAAPMMEFTDLEGLSLDLRA